MVLLGVITWIVGGMVYEQTVGWVNPQYQETGIATVYEDEPEVVAAYESYTRKELMIPSANGYEVEAQMLFAKEPSEKTVVVIHGIGTNMWRHFKEALMYLENGFNVVVYNQRYTHKTGGDSRTFGYLERHDLAAVMGYVEENYPTHLLGAHGFSMGAGTVGMYSGLPVAQEQADFLILDGPYDGMKGAIYTGIESDSTPVPTGYALWAGNLYNYIQEGFWYGAVDVTKEVAKSTMPMYVVVAGEDTVCLPEMGQAVYDAKLIGYKELWIQEGAEHVAIFDQDPMRYTEKMMAFIEKIKE